MSLPPRNICCALQSKCSWAFSAGVDSSALIPASPAALGTGGRKLARGRVRSAPWRLTELAGSREGDPAAGACDLELVTTLLRRASDHGPILASKPRRRH